MYNVPFTINITLSKLGKYQVYIIIIIRHRFLKDFIRNAQRGTLARLKLLERSEEEHHQIVDQIDDRIRDMEQKCNKVLVLHINKILQTINHAFTL